MRSIRRTLLATLLAAVTAVTLAASLLVYKMVRGEIDSIFDHDLRQLALTLQLPASAPRVPPQLDYIIQIWDPNGMLLFRSRSESALPPPAHLGFETVGEWRVYSADLAGFLVQVAQPLRVREQLAFTASMRTLAPVLGMLPLLAFLVWSIVGRALTPLNQVARAVASRTPLALDPLPEGGVPDEALPLVRSTNDLLRRLGAALDAQRAFVADAAHELRTPLAALRLQLQLVERATDASERAAALADLRAGLDRATHVVQQILTLARAEPEAASALVGEPVSLADLAAQTVADDALLAEAKGVDLGVAESSDAAVVTGDPAALHTLLANVIENAIRYTPKGGRIDVSTGVANGQPWLQVVDNGPGIPEADRARVFDRFYRRASGSEEGSGLGLAIVKAIADRHSAKVSLAETPGGGLTVRVEFPPPASRQSPASRVAPESAAPLKTSLSSAP